MIRVFTAATLAFTASLATIGWHIARRLTAPVDSPKFNLTIRATTKDENGCHIALEPSRTAIPAGIYNLWFEHADWTQLATATSSQGHRQFTCRVTGTSPGFIPQPGDRASWSGIYYATPHDAGLNQHDITIDTPAGPAPAWLFHGDPSIWAIHIHGLGSNKASTLRGVRTTTSLGYTSLAVTYRNSREGPRFGNGRSTLGVTEADDVESALAYAIEKGAERVVIIGWSMGAAIALQLASRSHHSDIIRGLILDSPVLNWTEVIKTNLSRSDLPAVIGNLARPWLTIRALARIIGLPDRIPLTTFDWITRADELIKPILILHGTRDTTTPIRMSQALLQRRPDLVTLEVFNAGHTYSWNSDPTGWQATVTGWLGRGSRPRATAGVTPKE